MKQFFKFMFASMIGTFITIMLASIISMVIFFGMIGSLISSASEGKKDKIEKVEANSILHIKLDYPINDRSSNNPFESFDFSSFESNEGPGLDKIIKSLRKAKTDDKIKGIYLDLTTINGGMATLEEIRLALLDFKKSGKWIISYSEIYTQGTYYLASVSDKVYLNPAGIVEHRGLSSELMFFKNALEKLDVEMQIIRHGKFKSAVEPYILEKMSDANREQYELLLNTAWGSMTKDVAASRNISVEKLNELADNMTIQDAKIAKAEGLVDDILFKDELLAKLREKLKIEADEEIKSVSLKKYSKSAHKNPFIPKKEKKSDNQIAVIYASGEINSGKSKNDVMGSETISEAIREARLDENVKAIVLRVNSPGGSAMASDIMWREVVLAKQAKPVIVSMGNVAASGGYYISCAADKIVADEKTITGSIGVFGVIPNAQGLMNNKLGITFDRVKTNKHGDIMSVFKPLTAEERDIIQIGVEKIYDDFITKVAEGRGMTKEEVDAIGQGRVWTGLDALKIGLVDEIGGLERAIEIAKTSAKLDDYNLIDYPKRKDPFEEIMEELTSNIEAKILTKTLGNEYKYYKKVQDISHQSGVMARMPLDIELH
ncbi:signal peptide peptidase SppA [Vicingus serpentipes]|uniref:Signal peptide peptidase SppA n=1 Tax=Vicingus serpentipes TaxID=1926625 RepID=A0A5C6RYA9_9FLAO|nr:signal peptide peptidase SppA [Vicingus serpentipes]TXB66955.1 signal peptide peptidase SppA [Vicingus serpentipes]